MAVQVLYQADILLDGIAASTDMNRVKLDLGQETKEFTAFGDVARHSLAGVYAGSVEGDFFYQTGLNMLANLLESEFPGGTSAGLPVFAAETVTVSDNPTVGGLVHMLQACVATAEHTGPHGEALKGTFKDKAAGTGRVVQGSRLLRAAQGAATSALGAAVNLGAVGALQAVYATLHVIGTTSTPAGTVFSIVSSATSSLTAPTTRLTFVLGTSARGGEWQSTVVGAITDTWWAAKFVGYAGTGFTASISAGIQ